MRYAYFDGSAGLSGDMVLGALLDLGVDAHLFKDRMAGLRLPVEIRVRRVRRGSLRALKVDVAVRRTDEFERTFADVTLLPIATPIAVGALHEAAVAALSH